MPTGSDAGAVGRGHGDGVHLQRRQHARVRVLHFLAIARSSRQNPELLGL